MPITAQSIVKEVQRAVNDYDGTRAPASDVVDLINKAQREILAKRPDSTSATSPFALVAGPKQSLPANAASLIDIPANATGNRSSISKCEMSLLDAVNKNWRSATPNPVIKHFMFDPRNPRLFWVYPPAVPNALVEMNASSYVDDIPQPSGDGRTWSTVSGNIGLNDEFEAALTALTLHMVYRSDLEGVMNLQLSDFYLRQASDMLGVQLTSTLAVAPKTNKEG